MKRLPTTRYLVRNTTRMARWAVAALTIAMVEWGGAKGEEARLDGAVGRAQLEARLRAAC